ncbi:TTC24 protein, partial [Upupa epops]|nr:TTC24 protein [Upupa epops]
IKGLMRAGQRALARGDARGALGCFRRAHLLSGGTASPLLCRSELPLQCQPSEGGSREPSGHPHANPGVSGEGLQSFPGSLACSGQGVEPCMAQAGSQACEQMGCCYLGLQEPELAARCFLGAASTYEAAASPTAAAVALSRASRLMLQSRSFKATEIAGVLVRCHSLCQSIPDATLRGRLYGEVGFGFAQLHIFSLAAESFERALALCSRDKAGQRREAVLLQNLGAAHNALHSFGTALRWHRQALALHGALGNRRAQGQCFGNLALACSCLGDHRAAHENYLHALQAFRDVGDLGGQWQVSEGLGTACCHLGDPQRAIGHYQEAL